VTYALHYVLLTFDRLDIVIAHVNLLLHLVKFLKLLEGALLSNQVVELRGEHLRALRRVLVEDAVFLVLLVKLRWHFRLSRRLHFHWRILIFLRMFLMELLGRHGWRRHCLCLGFLHHLEDAKQEGVNSRYTLRAAPVHGLLGCKQSLLFVLHHVDEHWFVLVEVWIHQGEVAASIFRHKYEVRIQGHPAITLVVEVRAVMLLALATRFARK